MNYEPHTGTLAILYRLPVISDCDGKESFSYVNPKNVSSISPDSMEVGYEFPSVRKVEGSIVVTTHERLFVPLTPSEVSALLDIELVEQ